jgi:hypothetical protein
MDVDPTRGGETDHVGDSDAGSLDLAIAGLAAKVGDDLVDVGRAGRAERVSLGEKPGSLRPARSASMDAGR